MAYRRLHWTRDEDHGRMAALRALTDKGKLDPMIRGFALRILRMYQTPPRDYLQALRAIAAWVQGNITYHNEPDDTYYDPRWTLYLGGGDCDDVAILTAALIEAGTRIPTRFKVLRRGGRGFHVYVEAGLPPKNPKTWLAVETVLPLPVGCDPMKIAAQRLRKLV